MSYRQKWQRLIACVALLVVGLAVPTGLNACSSSGGDEPAPAAYVLGGNNTYAIHVNAKYSDGSREQLQFGPGTEIGLKREQSPSTLSPIHPLTVDGGLPLAAPTTVDVPTQPWGTAWALVARAASACDSTIYDSLPPWSETLGDPGTPLWFLYPLASYPSCVDRIHLEQDLLCTADKLEELAEAVGVVTWPALQSPAECGDYTYGSDDGGASIDSTYRHAACEFTAEWNVPPQASKDRFIVRDLAIHTLGLIPVVDAFNDIDPDNTGVPSCSALVAGAAKKLVATPAEAIAVFGEPLSTDGGLTYLPFPPSSLPLEQDSKSIARSTLQIEAQILRSGGRLLHDLIRNDVYADMASAAQLSAQALDPRHGNQLAWGADPTQGPYGTLAHAARVLTGRWEIGEATAGNLSASGVGDPQCEGTPEIALLGDKTTGGAFGADYSTRLQDAPISTPGEAVAARLVDQAGIVLPLCNIVGNSAGVAPPPAGTLHEALVDQLLLQEQLQNGLTVNLSSPQRQIFESVLAPLSDQEIAFGFERANHTYRLLTNAVDSCAPFAISMESADGGAPTPATGIDPGAGLVGLPAGPSGPAAQSVANLNGIVVSGGIARTRVSTDAIARAGGMLAASQCAEGSAAWSIWGAAASKSASAVPYSLPTVDFQDAFHVGQAFERRLAVIQSVATSAALPTTSDDPATVARGGLAELRTWAGNTIVHAVTASSPTCPMCPPPAGSFSYIDVQIAGLGYSDLSLAATAPAATVSQTVQNAFGFVYGPPWVAECAAHLRSDCPRGFDAAYVQPVTSVSTSGGSSPPQAGLYDTVFDLVLMPPWSAPNFNPIPRGATAVPGESHLYMVRLNDPNDPAGHGRVLGALAIQPGAVTDFVDAPMQRELLHDAIDLGKWVGAKPPAIGDVSAANTAGFCVDGVPRDLFVPLDNELTAGSATYEDSWQHYLDLAAQAAQTADALGQQLIADDLQISENEQGASEQLANLCGDFGSLSSVTVSSNGSVSGAPDDQTTSSCLQEPTTDVVFLGKLPATPDHPWPTDPAAVDKAVRQILNCPAAGAPTTASTDPLCKLSRPLTADWLGIVATNSAKLQNAASMASDCGQVATIQSSLFDTKRGFRNADLATVLQDVYFSTGVMQTLASALNMSVNLWDEWTVGFGGEVIMSSTDAHYWPACLATAKGCQSSTEAESLNHAFRWCDGGDLDVALGCGGSVDAELNVLKWRVMQALMLVAASAGDAPAGMFQLPVPVAVGCGSTGPKMPWVSCAFPGIAAIPEAPLCDPTNKKDCLPGYLLGSPTRPTGPTNYEIHPRFTEFTANASKEIPAWYLNAYSHPMVPTALHAMVNTGEAPFGSCTWNGSGSTIDILGCDPSPRPIALGDILGTLMGPNGHKADGDVCATPFGAASGSALSHPTPQNKPRAPGVPPGPPRSPGPPTGGSKGAVPWDIQRYMNPPIFVSAPQPDDFSPAVSSFSVVVAQDPDGQEFDVSYASPNGYDDEFSPTGYATTGPSGFGPGPGAAAFAYIGGTGAPIGECGALSTILQAATLACVTGTMASHVDPTSPPPPVNSEGDVALLQGWISMASQQIGSALAGLYAESVPNRVVRDFQSGSIGTGDKGGTKGQAILKLEQDLQSIPSAWVSISGDLAEVGDAIATVSIAINEASQNAQDTTYKVMFEQVGIQGQLAQSVLGLEKETNQAYINSVADYWSVAGSGNPAGIGDAVNGFAMLSVDSLAQQQLGITDDRELGVLSQELGAANQTAANQTAQALASLNQTTAPLWTNIQTSVDTLRASVAAILADAENIQLIEGQAAYQAAIGTGADFVDISGQEVPIPVNTVLRRQASATAKRYATALTNAKALAYMARRAIEQRIGVPLAAITTPVGPLAAPSSWADDLCSLQGVNYASLSTAAADASGAVGDGGGLTSAQETSADNAAISEFADAWIGDYVAKLTDFVTYYNTQYPSHQGEDTAVLSLRYDLLAPATQCMTVAPNLLLSSGDLSWQGAPGLSAAGWHHAPCAGAGKCLAVLEGSDLAAPIGDPTGPVALDPSGASVAGIATGVSWLADVTGSGAGADAGSPDGANGDAGSGAQDASAVADATTGAGDAGPVDGGANAGALGPAANALWQSVALDPGTYVLSWWDQARDSNGNFLTSSVSPVNYVVEVDDGAWQSVATYSGAPFSPAQGSQGDAASASTLWSVRRTLSFTVTQPGDYAVTFAPSSSGDSLLGSVAIADVQLEPAQGDGEPTAYLATSASRLVPALTCSLSDSDVRAAFHHNCDANDVCAYDLTLPMLIDTAALNAGGSPLDGKLAQGNYNFRHSTVAVNLVGTGVHDCSNDPSPDCYGTGYVEYDLEHDATNAGIVGYDGNSRDFDFGVARVQHGKALAAERYITMPLSSADQQLVSQPGIAHIELGGRPLDGAYRLRIWDSPDLNWSALQDIQVILDYEYWSQIQTTSDQLRRPPPLHRAPRKPIFRSAILRR